ncbi:MAG: hypothetical protein AAB421_01385 [Patescibacteria group bacterium]
MEERSWFYDLMSWFEVPTVLFGDFTFSALILVVLMGTLGLVYFAVRAPKLPQKITAMILCVAVWGMLFVSHVEQLSYPKKLSLTWVKQQGKVGMAVHSAVMRPPKRIYLSLDIAGEPRGFWIPWTKELEKSLGTALEERRKKEGRGTLMFKFEPSEEKERFRFYLMPWPVPPDKDENTRPPEPYRLKRPEQEA